MKKILFASLLLTALTACTSCPSEDPTSLPRVDAASMNVDTTGFSNLFRDLQYTSTSELHSLMVLKDGKVIYERYDIGHTPEELHVQWSATKTYTALSVGFAHQDGLLDVNDPVKKFFTAEELPHEENPWLDELTIKHLLTMSSGMGSDGINYKVRSGNPELNPIKASFDSGFIFEPGTMYHYNSMDSYLLAVIVQRLTGKSLAEYLDEKLFSHLGITEYRYDKCQLGYNTGGWGLFLNTESMAKAGQFMLQRGKWNGEQLLDEAWFDEAMSAQILQKKGRGFSDEELAELAKTSDWDAGYCYQMWKCKYDSVVRMDGAHGQLVFIMPEKNAVAVMTSHASDLKVEFESFWSNIYCKL